MDKDDIAKSYEWEMQKWRKEEKEHVEKKTELRGIVRISPKEKK